MAHVTTIVVNISIDTADALHTSEAREVGFDMSQNICLTSGFDRRLLVSTVAVVVRFGFDSCRFGFDRYHVGFDNRFGFALGFLSYFDHLHHTILAYI